MIRSTNPLERFNREIRRRTEVVGDDWLFGRTHISLESMAALYAPRSAKSRPLETEEELGELIAA